MDHSHTSVAQYHQWSVVAAACRTRVAVEATASASWATTSSIPEWIVVIESVMKCTSFTASVTEIILTYCSIDRYTFQ